MPHAGPLQLPVLNVKTDQRLSGPVPWDRLVGMNMETIREWLRREPFEPFVIRMSNGEVHQVRHPENVALAKTRIIVTYPEADRAVHCSLVHINSIEAMQPA